MERTIWKYELHPNGSSFDMPNGAKILCVQEQRGNACLWALVDPTARVTKRTFKIYGTGHIIQDYPGEYIDTFQVYNGDLVFHVFETT